MRIRTVKPEFWSDQKIRRLSLPARLLYIATWNMADDDGNLTWDADYVRASVFMSDPDVDVAHVMAELEQAGRVQPYEVDGCTFAHLPNFGEHQAINRPSKWKNPPPPTPLTEDSMSAPAPVTEGSHLEGKGREGNRQTSVDDLPRPVDNSGSSSSYPQVVDAIVTVILEEAVADGRVRNPRAYRRGVMANVEAELGAEIRNQLELTPSARPATIATRVRRAMPAAVAVVGAQLHKVGPTPKHLLDDEPEPLPDEATMTPLQARAARRAK